MSGRDMYCVISTWSTTQDINEEIIAGIQEKFIPAIKAMGADRVYFVETGPEAVHVVVGYPDQETADAARETQEKIRAQAASQMPVVYQSEVRGPVFASG